MTEQEIAAADVEVAPDAWATELPAFAELIASLSDISAPDDSSEAATAESMDLDEITLSLAIELEVRDADGAQPRVTGSTPTQWTETTVMPVFHRLSMRVARETDA
ncbi:MAG TPA: hypothetical protein VJ717_07515 [Gemmatimonadaceae bacterium]|nr:hypothetical protein [Gemmatimonadaceae bacterium]